MKFERVLVIDPISLNAKMLANVLRGLNPACQVYGAQSNAQAMVLARELNPDLICIESTGPEIDALRFALDLRRSDLSCREAAMIMISADATAALIISARDSGIHEFLRRPYAIGDLQKRIDAVSGKPRDWIEAVTYIGPDRRRFNSADYAGPRKRRTDGDVKAHKVNQALKIVQSAAAAVETDPIQSLRALSTQMRILIEVSAGQEPLRKLGAVAMHFQAYLSGPVVREKGLSREQVDTFTANLLQVTPAEMKPKAA